MKIHNLFLLINMKNLMLLFGVTLAKRFTSRQKRIFYSQIAPMFKEMGYSLEILGSRKSLSHITNIVIGNVARARYVFICPYDTPSRSLLPFNYYPFNRSKNLDQENKELFLRLVIFIVFSVLEYFVFDFFSNLSTSLLIISLIFSAVLVLFGYTLIGGFSNPVNFNRNSASLALIAALAEKSSARKNICFVLLDKNTSSNAGLKALAEDERFKTKICIYLDCISEGEQFVVAHQKSVDQEAGKLQTSLKDVEMINFLVAGEALQETNLGFFPKILHVCVGTYADQEFFVPNTRSNRDMKVNIPRLEILRDGLLRYIKG